MRYAVLCLVLWATMGAVEVDPFRARSSGMGVEVAIEKHMGGDYVFGNQRYGWDDGYRYIVGFRSRIDLEGQVEPFGGIDFYWDERNTDTDNGDLRYQVLGFSLVSALAIHLLPQPETRQFTLSITPSLNGGIGLQNTFISNVSAGTVDVTDSTDNARFELGVSIGLRAAWRQRWQAEIGLGARIWTAGTLYVNGYNTTTTLTEPTYVEFNGNETYSRLSIGYWW